MNTKTSCALILALAVLVALSVPLAAVGEGDNDGDVQVTLSDLPAAVKATLLQAAGNGAIEEIEKEASGIFSADVVLDGKKIDIEIAADGTLIKTEADDEDEGAEVALTLNDVPAAVAAAIQQAAGSGTIDEIELDDEDGKIQYEAEITKDGKSVEIKVAADGTVVEVEVDDEDGNEAGEVD